MATAAKSRPRLRRSSQPADWAELVLDRGDWATIGNALARSSDHIVRNLVRHIGDQVQQQRGPVRVGASVDAWQKFLTATLHTLEAGHPANNIGGTLTAQLYNQVKR